MRNEKRFLIMGLNVRHPVKRNIARRRIFQSITTLTLLSVVNVSCGGSGGSSEPNLTVPQGIPRSAQVPNFSQIAAGQQCHSWCWAAGCETIARSRGYVQMGSQVGYVNVNQNNYALRLWGSTTACAPAQSLGNIADSLTDTYIRSNGSTVPMQGYYVFGTPSGAATGELIRSIQNGTPFLLTTYVPSHVYIIYAIRWLEYPNGSVQVTGLSYFDPIAWATGSPQIGNYTVFGADPNISGAVWGVEAPVANFQRRAGKQFK